MPEHLRDQGIAKMQHVDFELFFRMSADAMIIAADDGKVIDFNHAWTTLTGYSRSELFELSGGWDLVHQDDLQKLRTRVAEIYQRDPDTFNYQLRIICKNGSVKYLSYDSSLDKQRKRIYVICRDVTNERREQTILEQGESRLKFFFDNAIDGMCVLSGEHFQLVNKALLKIFGYDHESEMLGHHYLEFVESSYRQRVREIVHSNATEVYNAVIIRKDGTQRNVEIAGKTIFYKDEMMRISVLRDLDERRMFIEKIQSSEERFRAIFQNSSIGIVLIDEKGNFVEANNNFLQRMGYSVAELAALNILDLVGKNDKTAIINSIRSLLAKELDRDNTELQFIRKDRSATWSQVTFTSIHLPAAQQMVLALIEDTDWQKKNEQALTESEEKFRAVYESSPMGILIAKTPGIILDVNPAFCEMIGYAANELKDKNDLDFTHTDDAAKSKKRMNRIFGGEINNYIDEKRYIKKDGTTFWARAVVRVMNIAPGEIITVAIIENIDKKKKTEKALELKNRELVQINQELEHFAYVASHDLQEPLRTITSFIQILDRRYSTQFDEEAQQFMGFVVDGAKRMQTLIHDLLEYSRINRFNTGIEKVDLNDVFNAVNRVLKEKIERNDALILAQTLPVMYGSKVQLTQVFQNLIDNAIKFKAKKRKPEIIISVEDKGDKWELIFKDNGIGISPEYYQRIFVLFQRLHTLEQYSGTGIGLAICKKIIERHGGDIWVESEQDKGATFHFTLLKNLLLPIQ